MDTKLWITKHCKERYEERINNGLSIDILLVLQNVYNAKDITNKVLEEAPRYILYLYEKYGEFGQKILKNNDTIFILKRKHDEKDTWNVITCYKDNNYLSQYKNTTMSRKEIYIRIKMEKIKNNRKR